MFVRALDEKDWEIFKDIRLEAVRLREESYLASLCKEAKKTEQDWKNLLVQDNKRIFGLFDGDSIIGIGAVFTDKDDSKSAVIAMGYIKEAYRGRKLSRLLYQARIGWAKESGLFERISVSHRQGNDASRAANQAFGFKFVQEKIMIFGDGTQDIDFEYELRLK